MSEKLTLNKVAEALGWALRYDCHDKTDQKNIVSDFWNNLNQRGVIKNEEVESMIKLTHEKIGGTR